MTLYFEREGETCLPFDERETAGLVVNAALDYIG